MLKTKNVLRTSLVLTTSLLSWWLLRRRRPDEPFPIIEEGILVFERKNLADSPKRSPAVENTLKGLAEFLAANPYYKVVVQGNGSTRPAQNFSWKCVNLVIDYMVYDLKISENRFFIDMDHEDDTYNHQRDYIQVTYSVFAR